MGALLTTLQSRDLGVTVYTLAVYFQASFLIRNAKAYHKRRKPIFALSTALCVFGLAAALSSYFYSTAWADYRGTCNLRHPINSSFHLLALTCADLIHLYKMQVVNSGFERRLFLFIGTLFLLFRLASSATNSILSSSGLTPAGTCATKFNATSNTLLNISITLNNVVLGAMFVYPLRKHLSKMAGFRPAPSQQQQQSSVHVDAGSKVAKAAIKPKPAQTLIQKLVNAGLKWAILSSCVSTITYSLIASNVLGPITGMLVYLDWVFMTLCATEMLLEKPAKGEKGGDTSSAGANSQLQSKTAEQSKSKA